MNWTLFLNLVELQLLLGLWFGFGLYLVRALRGA